MQKNNHAISLINVGRTKTGKTTVSKKLLDKVFDKMPVFIYDVNNEYREYYDKDFLPFDEFCGSIKDVKNSFILIEEATIFLTVRETNKILVDMLVRKRHTNNFIVLNFHSFSKVPKYIFDLIDFVTVFKTNDSLKTVKDKTDFEKILKAFEYVKASENNFINKTISLY